MTRGINDPAPESENESQEAMPSDLLYEMQEVIQQLIFRHNELVTKVEKLETTLTEARIQFEAQKLVWNKGL
jgi:hypothetical protein